MLHKIDTLKLKKTVCFHLRGVEQADSKAAITMEAKQIQK